MQASFDSEETRCSWTKKTRLPVRTWQQAASDESNIRFRSGEHHHKQLLDTGPRNSLLPASCRAGRWSHTPHGELETAGLQSERRCEGNEEIMLLKHPAPWSARHITASLLWTNGDPALGPAGPFLPLPESYFDWC